MTLAAAAVAQKTTVGLRGNDDATHQNLDVSMLPVPARRRSMAHRPVSSPTSEAVATMEARGRRHRGRDGDELVWLVEHPPLYTAGTSARGTRTCCEPDRFPVYRDGRGGEYTYHGPGQRVAYVMLDLKRRRQDVRAFVAALEDWIIGALATINVRASDGEDRVGVWVLGQKSRRSDGTRGRQNRCDRRALTALGELSRHRLNVAPDLRTSTVSCRAA